MKYTKKWFTLVEILLWILIFTIVVLAWFEALSAVNIWKIKLIERTNITKDVVYFTEKLFEEIKYGGTLDYEEYFDRKVVWVTTQSWHYLQPTGFWNFWKWWVIGTNNYGDSFYYCKSWNAINMWTGWCFQPLNGNDFSSTIAGVWFGAWLGQLQRYGQYAFQFIDYNSNMNNDLWDENGDGNIRWDDDDEHLWVGPIVFTGWENVREIYLISWDNKKRTLLRWNWKEDPNKPASTSCDSSNFWSGCLGTIEMLKLEWYDWWMSHSKVWPWTYDGIIDTWLIDKSFWTWAEVIAWSNNFNYWQPLFPDSVSVSDFKVFLYPNTDVEHAWKDKNESSNINPYLRLSITLEPSWKKRVGIKWKIPKYTINTTINLVDYFTQ